MEKHPMQAKKNGTVQFLGYLVSGAALVFLSLYFAGVFPGGKKIQPGSVQKNIAVQDGEKIILAEEDIPVIYSSAGNIHSRDEIEISARITAKITKIVPREGDAVKKGETIVSLDDSDLKAALARTKEKLNEAQASMTLQEKELARDKAMFEKSAVSQKALDQSERAHEAAKANLRGAMEAVKEAEAALSYASLASPIDGIVSKRYLDPGDLALPGLKIIEIFDNQKLMLYVPIAESLVSKVKIGDQMNFEVDSVGKTFRGEVKEIARAIDPASRTFLVKICVGSADDLIPGMFGRLQLQTGSEKAVLIPEGALIRNGQLEYVLKLDDAGVPVKTLVRSAPSGQAGRLKIVSGLKSGDHILFPKQVQ